MQYNDYELIYMIKEDEEALDFLIRKYEPLFRSLSYSFAKKYGYKGIEQEDLIQQCRITLCKVVDKYDCDKEVLFYSYLLVCLKKSMINFCRSYSVKTDNFNYMDMDNYEDLSIFTSGVNIFEDYSDYEFLERIVSFKNSLSFLDAQVFELRYNGFSYKDIAVLLEINKKKVDNILVKIRKKMEKYFLFS
ncbi:MAG: sigma-70 family RNA polymerase sigma factor [Bacilli bacterium]